MPERVASVARPAFQAPAESSHAHRSPLTIHLPARPRKVPTLPVAAPPARRPKEAASVVKAAANPNAGVAKSKAEVANPKAAVANPKAAVANPKAAVAKPEAGLPGKKWPLRSVRQGLRTPKGWLRSVICELRYKKWRPAALSEASGAGQLALHGVRRGRGVARAWRRGRGLRSGIVAVVLIR